MRDTILVERENCYACVVRCKRAVKVDERGYKADPIYGGPEYETHRLARLASAASATSRRSRTRNQLCNAYCLDTIGTGTAIALAMECFERGTDHDRGHRRHRAEVRQRRGDGPDGREDRPARGLRRPARRGQPAAPRRVIGKGAEEFAMQVKGQEFPMHEPRIKQGLGVGYSLSPTGADHCHNIHDTTMAPAGA